MLIPASGAAGSQSALIGRNFGKRDAVVVRAGGQVVARARTSRRGAFTVTFTVPQYEAQRLRVVTRSRGRRIVNRFYVSGSSATGPVGEVVSRRGRRMRWSPADAPVGTPVQLSGSNFPRKRLLRIRFGGSEIGVVRADRHGSFATSFAAPALAEGSHLVRVKSPANALGFVFGTKYLLLAAPAGVPVAVAAPGAVTLPNGSGSGSGGGPGNVIYAAGDIACAPGDAVTSTKCRQKQTSDIIVREGAARVLALGDLQYNSASLANLRGSYDRSWGRFKSITSPAIGNHEGGGSGYYDYFNGSGAASGPAGDRSKGYYSYDVGSWHLIALNSNCARVACSAGSAQVQWLRADLAAHPQVCTLAYWHHPRFSSGHDGDGTFMQDIWKTLYDANADLVLVGHSHNYERFAPMNGSGGLDRVRGMREFVIGTGGAFFTGVSSARPNSEVRQNTTYGVLKLVLHPTSYDWRFVPESGRTFSDTGSQACH